MLSLLLKYSLDIIVILWIFLIARSLLFWIYFLQLKQYRLDRIFAEVNQASFWRLIFSPYRLIVLILFLAWQLVVRGLFFPEGAFILLYSLIGLFFLAWFALTLRSVKNSNLKLPAFTIKVWVMLVALMGFEVYIGALYKFNLEELLLIEFLQPLIVLAFFLVFFAPNIYLQRRNKRRAIKKRISMKGLTVIGITGSYGKTTTKEFLSHILSTKYKTLKTPDHINVDTGIAKFILKSLKPEHEMMVVEMGADRPRDIKKICEIVLPNYGMLTGLNFQHLQYFKNFKSLADTKFELFDAVKSQANMVVNVESKELVEACQDRGLKPIFYGQDERAFLQPENVSFSDKYIHFKIENEHFKVNVFGEAMLNNLLGAITVAHQLGISLAEISKAVTEINPIESTMEMLKRRNGSLFIDDSYNANTTGVITSLNDLKLAEKKKHILVFREVIELGKRAKKDHRLIAQHIVGKVDQVYLLESSMRNYLIEILEEAGFNKKNIYSDADLDTLTKQIDKDTVVLFEGPGTKAVMTQLL